MPAQARRLDFANTLIHLTRERIEYKQSSLFNAPPEVDKTVSPLDVLKEILLSGVIMGSGNEGFVKGTQPAACFSEAPLSAIRDFASAPNEPLRKYRYYGIACGKAAAFEIGARPVIYLPDNEGDWIPTDQKWRHVRYEHGCVDWTHEREWRAPGDFDLSRLLGLYVILWNPSEAQEIWDLECPLKNLIRGILPMEHLNMMM